MSRRTWKCLAGLSILGMLLAWGAPAMAVGEEEPGWSDTADFSLVATSGNSEAVTIGFKNLLKREWEKARLSLTAGMVRAESNDVDRFAVQGPGGGFSVKEKNDKDADPERYYFNSRYDRLISEKFFWYGGLDWERNRPSAVESRVVASGGVGNIWYDTETIKFYTDYGVTYTDEEDTSGESFTYAGLRVSWNYENKLTETTTYTNTLVIDENLDETSDFRVDMTNAVQVAMSQRMALKTSLQVQYDNEPAFEQIDLLENTLGGRTRLGSVDYQKDSTDITFTSSLVVNF